MMLEPATALPTIFIAGFVWLFICAINKERCERTCHKQKLYTYNKYSVWQCQKRGHVPYYELRRKLRWWGEDVVTFDTDVAVVVNKLKQLEEFPSKVDWGVVQYIRTELENK